MDGGVSPDLVIGKRRRQNPGRSKKGCLTCRDKHVRCDERQPVCHRCERLCLSCRPYWLQVTSKVKDKAPQVRSLRPKVVVPEGSKVASSAGSVPAAQLLSKSSSLSTSSTAASFKEHQVFHEANASDVEPTANQYDTWQPNGVSLVDWDWQKLSESESPEEVTQTSNDNDPEPFYLEPDIQQSTLISAADINVVSSRSLQCALPFCQSLMQLRYPPSTYHIALPNSLVLGREEHYALKHYQTLFSVEQTPKDPQWSFPMLLLHLATQSSITMHFALAASLYDLESQSNVDSNKSILAQYHFGNGSQLLKYVVENTAEIDHLSLMTSFYFVYICMSRQRTMNTSKIGRLSQVVVEHIKKYSLDSYLVDFLPTQDIDNPGKMFGSLANRSFLARLVFWLYKEDVNLSFYGCGGSLARHYMTRPRLIKDIWESSRPIMQLHWGRDYPASQCLIDIESTQVLDMIIELLQLRFEITEYSYIQSPHPRITSEAIEAKFVLVERKYSAIFHIANSPTMPTTDTATYAAGVVSIFHALNIFYRRCSKQPFGTPASPELRNSLISLLFTAQKVSSSGFTGSFDVFQWALFIAGLETQDFLHRDWIMSKLTIPRLKSVLKTITRTRLHNGGIVDMQTIREVFCGTSNYVSDNLFLYSVYR